MARRKMSMAGGLGQRVRMQIERLVIAAGEATAPRDYTVKLPRSHVYEALHIRIHGTHTIGVADATSVQTYGLQRLLRELKLTAGFPSGDKIVRSYTAKGVNDGVAGRTCSFGGVMLAIEQLIDRGTPVEVLDPIVTVGTNDFNISFTLDFKTPRSSAPHRTLLDPRPLRHLTLDLKIGILEALAAGDDTDVHVTAATTTAAIATCNVDVEATVRIDAAAIPFDLRIVRTEELALRTSAELQLDIGEDRLYRRAICLVVDDDVASDARVAELAWVLNKNIDIQEGRWGSLYDEARARYGYETALAGVVVLDHDPEKRWDMLNTFGAGNVDLVANVPAGAAVAADKLFALVEEIVLDPYNRATAAAAPKRRGGRRRR